jgi:3'-phosphoadenosine 5'-phosphosulfate sulfotransferase (PAPS reductase)/FAD synthetase
MIELKDKFSNEAMPTFASPLLGDGAVIAWWSGGITSAIACRLAIEKYPNVRLVYIETGSHHPDTIRFKTDCEKWYGQEIETIQNKKYEDHLDVVLSTRYVNGAGGARCTKELKKNVRFDFEKGNKIAAQVWGYEFEASEINRAIRTQEQYSYTNPLFPLIENKLSKNECAGILAGAGIDIPMMYKLGYNNNNCIGCVKGGAGYWNKIRVDFPEIFKQMAEAERK